MTVRKAAVPATTNTLTIRLEDEVPQEVANRATQAVTAIVDAYLNNPTATEDEVRLEQMRPLTEAEAHAVVVMALRYQSVRRELVLAAQTDQQVLERYGAGYRLLLDLDRCEHGRHSVDRCLMCPEGQSTGNLNLPAFGKPIGHTVHGHPIVIPDDPMARTDPRNWVSLVARDD